MLDVGCWKDKGKTHIIAGGDAPLSSCCLDLTFLTLLIVLLTVVHCGRRDCVCKVLATVVVQGMYCSGNYPVEPGLTVPREATALRLI